MRHGIDGKAQDQEDKPSLGIETYDEVNKDSLHVISSLGEVKLIINYFFSYYGHVRLAESYILRPAA
jgi:hypothetical protein